jgi:hypothetical protein
LRIGSVCQNEETQCRRHDPQHRCTQSFDLHPARTSIAKNGGCERSGPRQRGRRTAKSPCAKCCLARSGQMLRPSWPGLSRPPRLGGHRSRLTADTVRP